MVVKKPRKPRAKKAPTKKITKSQYNIGKGPNININIDQSKRTKKSGASTAPRQPQIISTFTPVQAPAPIYNFPLPTPNLNPFESVVRETQKPKIEEKNELEKPKPKEKETKLKTEEENLYVDMPPLAEEETEEEKLKRIFKGNTPPPNPFKLGATAGAGSIIGSIPKKEKQIKPSPPLSFAEELKAAVGGGKLKKTKPKTNEVIIENIPLPQPIEEVPLPRPIEELPIPRPIEEIPLPRPIEELPIPLIPQRENDTALEEEEKKVIEKPTILNMPKITTGKSNIMTFQELNEQQQQPTLKAPEEFKPFMGGGVRLGDDSIIERLNREELRRKYIEKYEPKALTLSKTPSPEIQAKETKEKEYKEKLDTLNFKGLKAEAKTLGIPLTNKNKGAKPAQVLKEEILQKYYQSK